MQTERNKCTPYLIVLCLISWVKFSIRDVADDVLHVTSYYVHYERWWQLYIILCAFAAFALFVTRYDMLKHTFIVLDFYQCIAYAWRLYACPYMSLFSSVECSRGNADKLLMASHPITPNAYTHTHIHMQIHKCRDKIDDHRLPKWLSLYNRQLPSKLPSAWWFDYCHNTQS